MRPPLARRRTTALGRSPRPTCSTTMSAPRRPVSRFTSATRSAGRRGRWSRRRPARAPRPAWPSVDAVAITRAPNSFAIWMAADAHARARRQHQHRLALPDRGPVDQHLPGGHEHGGHRRQLGVVQRHPSRGAGTTFGAGTTTYSACPPQVVLAHHAKVGAQVVAADQAAHAAAAGQPGVHHHPVALGRARRRRTPGAQRRDDAARRRRPARAAAAPAAPAAPAAATDRCGSARRRVTAHQHLARPGHRAPGPRRPPSPRGRRGGGTAPPASSPLHVDRERAARPRAPLAAARPRVVDHRGRPPPGRRRWSASGSSPMLAIWMWSLGQRRPWPCR